MQPLALLAGALACAAAYTPHHLVRPGASRAAINSFKMQEIAVDSEPLSLDKAETSLDVSTNEAPPEQTRFKAISLNQLDSWGEKFPRLAEKMQDIQRSALIFPFKASPYLVEELIDWEMEGDIGDDPFYRLVFPTMAMLSPEHRKLLDDTCDEGDPFRIKEVVEEIRESLNPHPAGQKTLNAPKKAELTGVQHKYSETVLFFAAAAQTCHAYCT